MNVCNGAGLPACCSSTLHVGLTFDQVLLSGIFTVATKTTSGLGWSNGVRWKLNMLTKTVQ